MQLFITQQTEAENLRPGDRIFHEGQVFRVAQVTLTLGMEVDLGVWPAGRDSGKRIHILLGSSYRVDRFPTGIQASNLMSLLYSQLATDYSLFRDGQRVVLELTEGGS